MSKYDALGLHLRRQPFDEVQMSFSDIERVTGAALPPKAQLQPAWWSNNPSNNVMTKVWLAAGFRTERVNIAGRRLVFRRLRATQSSLPQRLEEGPADFRAERQGNMKSKHPLIGALKGTFSIEPGWDITGPSYTPEEWAEAEKEMEADWDDIEKGMSGSKK